jgi:AcrR family transcriptional regulator
MGHPLAWKHDVNKENGMKRTGEAAARSAERREKKKAMRQEQLVDAAEKVFLAHGYEAATIDMITEEIGYNKRTFYLYFRDRDDVFFAVLLRSLRTLYALMRAAADSRRKGVEKLIAMGRAYFGLLPGKSRLLRVQPHLRDARLLLSQKAREGSGISRRSASARTTR